MRPIIPPPQRSATWASARGNRHAGNAKKWSWGGYHFRRIPRARARRGHSNNFPTLGKHLSLPARRSVSLNRSPELWRVVRGGSRHSKPRTVPEFFKVKRSMAVATVTPRSLVWVQGRGNHAGKRSRGFRNLTKSVRKPVPVVPDSTRFYRFTTGFYRKLVSSSGSRLKARIVQNPRKQRKNE